MREGMSRNALVALTVLNEFINETGKSLFHECFGSEPDVKLAIGRHHNPVMNPTDLVAVRTTRTLDLWTHARL